MKERERRDLDRRDYHSPSGRSSVPERDECGGDENGDEAREVLRLGERLQQSRRRVDAQVVEDGEVEDQKRQESAGQAEQQTGRVPRGLVDVGVRVCLRGSNIT